MEEKRSWWQHLSWWRVRYPLRITIGVGAIVFVVFIVIIIIGYQFDWTGFNGYTKVTITHIISGTNAGTVTRTEEYQPGKGLWDWLQLLAVFAVPIVVGFGAVWFTTLRSHDREIAADNQREAALQGYLDKMSDLLLREGLRESGKGSEQRTIAVARTLTVLSKSDSSRKRTVLKFLFESALIVNDNPIVDLSYANLKEADLNNLTLFNSNLKHTNLSYSNLENADLKEAILFNANLEGANLSNANLEGANLKDARGITIEELEKQAKSLKGATMPDGSIHN